ncbi:MAG: type II secretion system ATPase GspE [Pseudomonadota bacterium]
MKTQIRNQINEAIDDLLEDLSSLDEKKLSNLTKSEDFKISNSSFIGDILLVMAAVTADQLNDALATQKNQEGEKKEKLGEILMKKEYITEDDLYKALSYQLNIPFLKNIDVSEIDIELIKKVPISFAKKFKLLPIEKKDNAILVAISDPSDFSALDDIRILLESNIKPVISKYTSILDAINKSYDKATTTDGVMDDLDDGLGNINLDEPEDLLDANDEAPIIRLVNSLLYRAAKEGASDVHVEPFEKDVAVRFRVDGALHDIMRPPKRLQSSITSRLKIMANLNIAEKRLPQDGRIKLKIAGKDIDIRMNTLPTAYGERVVMRLLDKSNVLIDLKDLGFMEKMYNKILEIIYKPHGIFLVTGPTGSGKTTTLYACLNKIYSVEKNIITVEDPIEYQLQGIGQLQVNSKIDMTFANGLRAILRQDPDVIMIGEIRDTETAKIAVQASLTGHFVFSTLHTNDSFSAVTRLSDMDIEPFLVSSSLVGVLAQRLVRKVCPACALKYNPTDKELAVLGLKQENMKKGYAYKAVGCKECGGTGYKGRMGIYELLPIDDELRSHILGGTDTIKLKRSALDRGMYTLREDGADKVANAFTTIEEVLKVTQVDTVIE